MRDAEKMVSVNRVILSCVVVLVGLLWQVTSSSPIDTENDVKPKVSVRQDVRIRKEFTAMSFKERVRFIRVYKYVSMHQPYRRRFEYLVGLHSSLFSKVHVEKQFFPWHRWYLLQFENLFRRIDSRVTMPYWDWSLRSQKLWHSDRKSVWNNYPWGLGGNGTGHFNCVNKGPFGKRFWRLARKSGGGCLRRNFMGRMPSVVGVHLTLRINASQFKHFEKIIRKFYHNELHCCIQGTMELETASNTPEFLLHHTFMDKIWYDWQNKGEEYRMKLADNMGSTLRGSHYKIHHFMDPNNLGYTGIKLRYVDPYPGYKRLHATLSSLDADEIKMLDSYDEKTSKRHCCPHDAKSVEKKVKEISISRANIPLEVAIDYGE